jgi:hypothetical protein
VVIARKPKSMSWSLVTVSGRMIDAFDVASVSGVTAAAIVAGAKSANAATPIRRTQHADMALNVHG